MRAFALLEQGKVLNVSYQGMEPPPDTFKDDAQALAVGNVRAGRGVPCDAAAGQVRFEVCSGGPGWTGCGEGTGECVPGGRAVTQDVTMVTKDRGCGYDGGSVRPILLRDVMMACAFKTVEAGRRKG